MRHLDGLKVLGIEAIITWSQSEHEAAEKATKVRLKRVPRLAEFACWYVETHKKS